MYSFRSICFKAFSALLSNLALEMGLAWYLILMAAPKCPLLTIIGGDNPQLMRIFFIILDFEVI